MFKGPQLDRRISLIIFIFSFLLGLLLIKSAYLQWFPIAKFARLKNKIFDRTVTLKPRRGVIYDRYGKELVISIPSQSLFADPQRMREPYYSAKKLSQLLNVPQKTLLKKLLNKKRRFVWVKRHLSEKEIQKIKSWKLKGLYFIKESKRFYTKGSSLSQVLGFTGIEGQGLEGIEKQYDEVLKGKPQKVLIKRDAKGRPLFMDFSPFIEKVSGFDVYLTIDSDLQFYLEKSLRQAIIQSKALSALAVILSADNSEVLAMANIPSYNPNKLNQSRLVLRRNKALTDIFEPGSTLKTFTLASALQKKISPAKVYPSRGGYLEIGSSVIREADPKKKFKPFLNLSEILALSSNVGVAGLALDIGAKSLRKTLWNFGFGRKTGIDFPGEAKGLLRPLPWRPVETATISFGHGIAGTALQIANAYAAIANGGLLKQPLLVKKIKNPYTGDEQRFSRSILRRVISPEMARHLTLMLIAVTEPQGTGVKAAVPGYFVAGKTGTAQKVDLKNKGYKEGEYISSFAGFIPAHKPKFVIYLMIDGAKDNFYSSSLVAPMFSRLAGYAVRKAGLSPTVLEESNMILSGQTVKKSHEENPFPPLEEKGAYRPAPNRQIAATDSISDLRGLSLREVLKKTKGSGWPFKIYGSGRLTHTLPPIGDHWPENQEIILFFN